MDMHALINAANRSIVNVLQYRHGDILNEDTQPVIRAIGVSHTACKDEFRQNLRSHSWSVLSFS